MSKDKNREQEENEFIDKLFKDCMKNYENLKRNHKMLEDWQIFQNNCIYKVGIYCNNGCNEWDGLCAPEACPFLNFDLDLDIEYEILKKREEMRNEGNN